MRGHEPLLAMRRAGHTPKQVCITVGSNPFSADWPRWFNRAEVEVGPDDAINRLDLRCVVGLPVVINGSDAARVTALHSACVAAKAARVVTSIHDPRTHAVLRLIDSDGKLEGTWPN